MFKIGDKVKIIPPAPGAQWKTGVVIKKDTSDSFDYHVRLPHGDWCPYYTREIELAIRVGEQLEFDFMKEEPHD